MRTVKEPSIRREEILNAAFELFCRDGYQNTTVESIVQKASVAKGSFYNYFKSKEEVSEAIIIRLADNIVGTARELLGDLSRTPKQRLADFTEFTLRTGIELDDGINKLILDYSQPSIRAMYIRASDDGARLLIPMLFKVLNDGNECGDFHVADAYFTAAVIVGALQKIYTAFFEMQDSDYETVETYVHEFMDKLLNTSFSER